jgi:hypothetical protein
VSFSEVPQLDELKQRIDLMCCESRAEAIVQDGTFISYTSFLQKSTCSVSGPSRNTIMRSAETTALE